MSHRRRLGVLVCVVALAVPLAGVTSTHATPEAPARTDPREKIEPQLETQLNKATTADFWVRFDDQPDLSRASQIGDWGERGAAVAAVLRETAAESQADVRDRLDAEDVRYESFWATNAIYVREGSNDLAEELAARPEVDSLHPTTTYDAPEPEPSNGEQVRTLADSVEWGIADINADDVWEQYDVRGDGITVANIDTGVQYSHPALVNQYRGSRGDGAFDHDYNWFDAAGQCSGAPCDGNGHGTHTMGTMVGDDGGENRIGVAPDVTWIAANGCCPSDALRAIAHVDLSIDGGATWETLLEQASNARGPAEEIIPIPQAADQPAVRVRFRLSNHSVFSTRFWQVDDVFVGTRSCEPATTGLVLGHVRDRNTGDAVNGAIITGDGNPLESSRSAATPDDPALDDGFYWMFSSLTGRQGFTATADSYRPDGQPAAVDASRVTERDFRLPAGRLSVEPDDLTASVREGRTAKVRFTVTNTGSAPAQVDLRERDTSYEIPRAPGATAAGAAADVVRVPGEYSPLAYGGAEPPEETDVESGQHGPTAGPWLDLPDYPIYVMDNAVGELDGKIYSAGGRDDRQVLTDAFVYDPAEKSWSEIADLPEPLQAAAGAVIDGKFYVAGGWPPLSQGSRSTYVYDPTTDSWSQAADAPFIFAAAGRAVLDGQLYTVGGCTNQCGLSGRVFRYDPPSDSWEELARYPESTSHLACAGIAGQVYCAGGTRAGGIVWDQTYAYDPATDTWTRKADLPIQLWGTSYTASSDRLVVSGGVTGGATALGQPTQPTALTNEGFVYDPATDTWTGLPPSNNLTYRAGNTCGLTKVGGTRVVGFLPVNSVELLPTYGDCVPADVPWLSLDTTTVTLAPGQKAKVTLTLDATEVGPGSYAAGLWIKEDTPYLVYPVDIAMTVPPSS